MTPIAMTIPEAVRASGVGRSTIYAELASGRLVARKLGRRTLVMSSELERWLESLPALKARGQ
jgi:excisionase family DNA binding protein